MDEDTQVDVHHVMLSLLYWVMSFGVFLMLVINLVFMIYC